MILLLNLKSFFLSNKLLSAIFSILLVVCLAGGLFGINYVYCNLDYYNNYLTSESTYKIINTGIDESEPVKSLLNNYSDKIDYANANFKVTAKNEELEIEALIYAADFYYEYAFSTALGHPLTKEDIINGSHKITLDYSKFDSSWIGKLVNIAGTDYEVVGLEKGRNAISFFSLSNTSICESITFHLTEVLGSAKEKKAFNDELFLIFMGQRLEAPENDTLTLLGCSPMMIPTIILIVLGFLNLSFLYIYFIKMRQRQYSIYRICGASRFKIFLIFIGEVLALFTISFIVSIILYNIIMAISFNTTYSMMIIANITAPYLNCMSFTRYIVLYILLIVLLTIAFIPSLIKSIKSDNLSFGEN